MIKLKCYETGGLYEFKTWREAHYELDLCGGMTFDECSVRTLEHYGDSCTHDDFGNPIGRECVLESFEEIEE